MIDCPRCSTKLFHSIDHSRSSTIHNEPVVHLSFVSGYRCWNCGYWQDDETISVRKPPRKGRAPVPYTMTVTDKIVWEFQGKIRFMQDAGDDLGAITRLLVKMTGFKKLRQEAIQNALKRLEKGILHE